MTRLCIIGALICCAALAALPVLADTATLSGKATITLRETDRPGALAEIHFNNAAVNDEGDEGHHILTLDGLTVGVEFDWNIQGDDDAITVQPPDGVTCDPVSCVLQLPESDAGTLWLYDAAGVGM